MENKTPPAHFYMLVDALAFGSHEWLVHKGTFIDTLIKKQRGFYLRPDYLPHAFASVEDAVAWCSAEGREADADELLKILALHDQQFEQVETVAQAELCSTLYAEAASFDLDRWVAMNVKNDAPVGTRSARQYDQVCLDTPLDSYLLVDASIDGTYEWQIYNYDYAFIYQDKLLQYYQGEDFIPHAFRSVEDVVAWCSARGREAVAYELRSILASLGLDDVEKIDAALAKGSLSPRRSVHRTNPFEVSL